MMLPVLGFVRVLVCVSAPTVFPAPPLGAALPPVVSVSPIGVRVPPLVSVSPPRVRLEVPPCLLHSPAIVSLRAFFVHSPNICLLPLPHRPLTRSARGVHHLPVPHVLPEASPLLSYVPAEY